VKTIGQNAYICATWGRRLRPRPLAVCAFTLLLRLKWPSTAC
jgi:hypothetical protein